jgi:lipopolysaccharide transport system permease protein
MVPLINFTDKVIDLEQIETTIRPPANVTINLKELWRYRELFYFFTWRDIKVKYKQTILGIAWALLQPLAMMLLFTFIFSRTLKLNFSATIPFPLFVLSGILIWNLFNGSVSHAGESMIQNAAIIKKIYFPRLIVPVSAILVNFFDFLMAFIIFAVISFFYGAIQWTALFYFPAAILLCVLAAFGMGSFLSALNVKFRDFRYIMPFLLQLLFFASQIIYPINVVQNQQLKFLLALNPVNGAIELFRTPLTGLAPDMTVVLIGVSAAILLGLIGIIYFRKTESYFADIA